MGSGHLQRFKSPTGGSNKHPGKQWAMKPWSLSVKPPTPRQARVQVKENLKLTFKEGTTMRVSQSVAG